MQTVVREAKSVWQECLRIIREYVPDQSFKTWFEPIVPARLVGSTLTIQVPSEFFYEWLEENYVHILRKAIDHAIGTHGLLEYSVIVDRGDDKKPPMGYTVPNQRASAPQTPTTAQKRGFEPEQLRNPFDLPDLDGLELTSYLNPIYTFENYVEGDCNRLARSAGQAVATKPGLTSFNPLMIYGGVGLGKTHLAQAIGNQIKAHNQHKFVLFVSTEKFMNQFVMAVRNNSMQNFTNFYLRVDVLILDDVQFLAGKERTQETFFHIFNHLHQTGKQIIMTSDRPPKDLQGLQDRLLSRFKWGLSADLQTPDLETRIAIILKKLHGDGVDIDYQVVEYLAHSIDTNVRELEGVVVSLIAQATLLRREVDMNLARQVLRNIVQDSEREVTIETIMEGISDHYRISIADLKGKSRKKEIVLPRQIAMYFAKEYTDLSLKSIGYHFGGRDHSTVIHAIQNISELKEHNSDIRSQLLTLQKQFGKK
ncbi:MAG: chromosomal replication initiator protein DnaA [Siphonobacter sp.]